MPRLPGIAQRLGANAARALRQGAGGLVLPRGRFWVRLRLASPVPELAPPSLLQRDPPLALFDVLQVLDRARRDPRVAGVVVRLDGPPGGFARAATLERALRGVREAGRPVVVWAPRLSAEEMLVASGAGRVFLPESGAVFLLGLRLQTFFVRGLLERVGLRADVVRVGDYKSAAEMFTRDGMSPEQREQLEALAEDLWGSLLETVARGRGMSVEKLRDLVDRGPHMARAAREAGLVDGCLYPDELEGELLRLAPGVGEPDRVPLVDASAYLSLRAADPGWRPLRGDLPRVAYVVASGAIHGGGGLRGVAADAYRGQLERLRRDERLAGVLLRVDSPGGDAVSSDLLWRSLRRVGEKRPVVASLGDVAASGGFFLAAGAAAVVAEASTLTGSIGVVGGKLDLSRLYERLGVRKETVERGARAGMLGEERAFAPDERKAVREEMAALYELFVDRVATGRGMDAAAVHAVGRGRIWSGRAARERGLVDVLGGPLEALAELRRRAGLGSDEPLRIDLHPRLPRLVGLRTWLRPWRLDGVAHPLV